MSGVFSGVLGEYSSGYWYSRSKTLSTYKDMDDRAENVTIIAGTLSVESGTYAENVNVLGVTYSVKDSAGNIDHRSNYGCLSIHSGGSARNVHVGSSGHVNTDGVIDDLYLDSGAFYANYTATALLYVHTDGAYIERLESGLVATGLVSGLDCTGSFYASSATLENMTFNWWYDDVGRYGNANAYLYNGTYLKGGVVSGMSDSNLHHAAVSLLSGASASGTLVDGGLTRFSAGARGEKVVVQSGGVVAVGNPSATEQALVTETMVSNGGLLSVCSSGSAKETQVYMGGTQTVGWQGFAEHATIYSGGTQVVSGSSGLALNTRLLNGATEIVEQGEARRTHIEQGAVQKVTGWGTACSAVVEGEQQLVGTYCDISSSVINNGGKLLVTGRGSGFDITVRQGGTVEMTAGAILGMTLADGAMLSVADGARVSGLVASRGANVVASGLSGWYGTLCDVDFYNTTLLASGGLASDVRLHSGAVLEAFSSSYTSNFTVYSGATANFASGASFSKIKVGGGVVNMSGLGLHGLTLSDGIVNRNGMGERYASGSGNSITAKGIYNVSSSSEWRLQVADGGIANLTSTNVTSGTVSSGGTMVCHEGTQLNSQTVSGGGLLVVDGLTATGRVSMSEGSELNFALAGRSADDVTAWVSGFSYFTGSAMFSMTIDAWQKAGDYVLADAKAAWVERIRVQDAAGDTLEWLYAGGEAVAVGRNTYSLSLGSNNSLMLTVTVDETVGTTYDNVVLGAGENLHLSSYDVATGTTMNGGRLYVSSGGMATGATVNSGWLYVYSGGTATGATMNGGWLYVNSGGMATGATVNSGWLYVSSGGTATGATVNSGGSLNIFSGGRASNIVENGGCVSVAEGASVNFASNTISGLVLSTGSMTVHSGTTANSTTIANGNLHVSSGGTANSTMVNGGWLNVSSGGTANSAMVNGGWLNVSSGGTANSAMVNGGWLNVSSGGTANSAMVNGGWLDVSSGGTANDIIVNSGGSLVIFSGGTATNIAWTPCVGVVSVYDGGYATFTSKYSGCYLGRNNALVSTGASFENEELFLNSMYVFENGTACSTTVNSGGRLYVWNGGTANITTVNSFGSLIVSSGGTALNVVENGGFVSLAEGAVVNFANNIIFGMTRSGGVMTIHSGTTANSTTMKQGRLYVYSGGTANATVLDSGGSMLISSGGTANETLVNSSACLTVSSGGMAHVTTINSYGSLTVSSGGTALNVLENGGYVSIAEGTDVSFVSNVIVGMMLSRGGAMTVHSCTIANSTTVGSGGSLAVCNGGTANSTMVDRHGTLVVSSGGTATGIDVLEGGALILTVAPGTYIEGQVNGSSFVIQNGNAESIQHVREMHVFRGGSAAFTTMYGLMFIYDGGMAVSTTITGATNAGEQVGGNLDIYSGGTAIATTMEDAFVNLIGGMAVSTTVNRGSLGVYSGGMAISTAVNSRGILFVSSGGTASSTFVNKRGRMLIHKDGYAIDTTILPGGSVTASSGAIFGGDTVVKGILNASGAFVRNTLSLTRNGQVSDIIVQSDAVLSVAGGKMEGEILMEEGSELNILLAGASPDDLDVWLEGGSNVTGALALTITVDDIQCAGTYILADDASRWNADLRIQSKAGEQKGVISIGGENIVIGKNTYALSLLDNLALALTVTVDFEEPSIVDASSSLISWESEDPTGQLLLGKGTGFVHLSVENNAVSLHGLPQDTFSVEIANTLNDKTSEMVKMSGEEKEVLSELLSAEDDGLTDLFFARSTGLWNENYLARHTELNFTAGLAGRNNCNDLFVGSDDASILLLTDDANGDSLFVDDVFSAFPEGVEAQSRIAKINEIRAGVGDDIIDLTSQRFEYNGDGITVKGGDGNDVIWVNKGDNLVFGDAGNDHIVGALGNDVIVGGAGDDVLHGGGGNDIFAFGDEWGYDSVEQLSGSKVTLWFKDGDASKWNDSTLCYTDGRNSVKVSGVALENITLKFGDDGSDTYQGLLAAGAFSDFSSHKIFEDKGMLA